jgi:hypothetical protein
MTFFKRWKFSVLLAILLTVLVAQPHLAESPTGVFALAVFSLVFQIVTMIVVSHRRTERIWAVAFGVPAVIAVLVSLAAPAVDRPIIVIIGHCVAATFCGVSVVLILRYVFLNEVTGDHVVAALVAYLLIGVGMGQLYFVLHTCNPHAFRTSASVASALENPHTRSACLAYFSFVTLTTSGYGDIIPDAPLTRTLAWLEAVVGQFYLAVLVAGLIGMRVSRSALNRAPGDARAD